MSAKTKTKQEQLETLIRELAVDFKGESDLSDFTHNLVKTVVESALNAELDDHLGYSKHDPSGHNSGNNRNGSFNKKLKGSMGEVVIDVPRDRNGSFEPQFIEKGQSRLTQFDDQILSCYARGMTTRDISATFEEMYGAKVSHTVISKVTEAVIDEVNSWQSRPLEPVYPIVYLDCLVVKVHQEKRVINKSVYLALGVDLEGQKELLGMWIEETEGAKFWLSVLTELKNRGVQDFFFACVDGLTGFPDAINTVYPQTKVMTCIVHMVRNSLKYVSWKDRKEVAKDLKKIYLSITAEEAERELEDFAKKWDSKYAAISQSWHRHWPQIVTLFEYPNEIRKVIYTTNAIESLNSVIRKSIKNRRIFPSDRSVFKVIYLSTKGASKKWTMPIRDWGPALSRFTIEFGERLTKFI